MKEYYCLLYEHEIAEGLCLDINYERLGYMSGGCLEDVLVRTGKSEPEVSRACTVCPNNPKVHLGEGDSGSNSPSKKSRGSDS